MPQPVRKHGHSFPQNAELAAWRIMLGEQENPLPRSRMRKHRGMLPDVDFGAAVRELERRSVFRRIAGLIWPRMVRPQQGPDLQPPVSRSSPVAVGKAAAPPYIRLADTGGDKSAAPDGSEVPQSRAA